MEIERAIELAEELFGVVVEDPESVKVLDRSTQQFQVVRLCNCTSGMQLNPSLFVASNETITLSTSLIIV